MTVWEIVILMVMATVCVASGIGVVYNSIVNTVERYQIRKAKRELEIFTKVMEEIPNLLKNFVNMVMEKDYELNKKRDEEFANRIRELKQDE